MILGVSFDKTAEDPRTYTDKNQMTWPPAFGGDMAKSDAATVWGVTSIPNIFLIAPDGTVIARDLRGDRIRPAVASALGN